jgi:hypothetical protein
MIYTGTQINTSATYAFPAAVEIADPRNKAIVVTADGAKVATGSTEAIMGVALITNDFPVKAGEDVHVQIKEIGYVKCGGEVTVGAALTANAEGLAVVATEGAYVLGTALTSGVAGDIISVQIVKYKG